MLFIFYYKNMVPDIKYGWVLNIETAPNTEYMLSWALIGQLWTKEFYAQFGIESTKQFLYNQNEFAWEFWYNLCTIYSGITALSALLGREISREDRYNLAKLRHDAPDFQPTMGWLVSAGVDIIRKYWNEKYPNEKLVSFYVQNTSSLRVDTLLDKNIPLISGYSGNSVYNSDIRDGVLNGWEYKPATYGHSIAYMGLNALDNYNNRYTFSKEVFKRNNRDYVNHAGAYLLSKVDIFNGKGQSLIDAMNLKIWNGERVNEWLTRRECALILGRRLNRIHTDFWDGSRPSDLITDVEMKAMTSRAYKPEQAFDGCRRRWEFIIKVMSI